MSLKIADSNIGQKKSVKENNHLVHTKINGRKLAYFVLATNKFRIPQIFCGFCKTVIEAEMPAYDLSLQMLQLKEYQKDLEYRLHHRLSKFDRSVFLILKPIYYFFLAFIWLGFLSRNYWSSLDHNLMASIAFEKKPFQFWREI